MPSSASRCSMLALVLLTLALVLPTANGQILASWSLNGTIDSANGVAPSSTFPTVTAGSLTISPSLTSSVFVNAFVADNWPSGGFNSSRYMEFSVSSGSGRSNNYQSVEFNLYNNFSGSCNWSIRSSVDAFSFDLDSGTATSIIGGGQAISANISLLGEVAGPVIFRIYTWNNTGTSSPLRRGLRGTLGGGQDLAVIGQTFAIVPEVLDPADVYLEDFESGTGAWSVAHLLGSAWEYGTPITPSPAFSGNRAFSVDLDDDYVSGSLTAMTATFDCTAYTVDPLFSMRLLYDAEAAWDGVNIEIDTGSGFSVLGAVGQDFNWYNDTDVDGIANGADGWSGDSGGWQRVARTLSGAAGSVVTLRIVFGSDGAVVDGSGAMVDDIRIVEAPAIIIPNAEIYEDFESGPGGWQRDGVGTQWEWGMPSGGTLSTAFSGSNAFGTDLGGLYDNNTLSSIERAFDARLLLDDPVFEMQVNYDSELGWDGVNVEVDVGAGFETLGVVDRAGNWYDDSDVDGIGNNVDGWSGNSGGWRRVARTLTGTAGELFTVRISFGSDNVVVGGDGVLVDDIRIAGQNARFAGTGEDLETIVVVDSEAPITVMDRATDEITMRIGEFLDLSFQSPLGTFVGDEFVALASVGPVGMPFEILPDIFIGTTAVGVLTPMTIPGVGPYRLPAGGFNVGFIHPGVAGVGLTLYLQAAALTGSANNMIYASTDALEVQFKL